MQWQLGDWVALIGDGYNGIEGEIIWVDSTDHTHFKVRASNGKEYTWYHRNDTKLIRSKNMSLISKFKNITRKEPERTFVKAGVMSESLELTSEGTALFLSYMLEKHKDDFKKEVVDPIVAEMDKEESK